MRSDLERISTTVFWASLGVYLLVLPIANTIAIRYLAFLGLMGSTALVLLATRRAPQLPFPWAWAAYILVAAIAVVFAHDQRESLSEFRVETLYWLIVFSIGVTWGSTFKSFVKVATLLALINAALSVTSFLFISLDMDFTVVTSHPPFAVAGLDGNWLLIAIFFNAWLLIHLYRTNCRWGVGLLAALIALDLWAMLASYNRQNLIALIGGIGIGAGYLLLKHTSRARIIVAACSLLIAAAALAVQLERRPVTISVVSEAASSAYSSGTPSAHTPKMGDIRWELWSFVVSEIEENPWIGRGLGRSVFKKIESDFVSIPGLWHAHNMVLNKGIQMGILGMVAFLALWASLWLTLLRHKAGTESDEYLVAAGLAAVSAIFLKNQTDDFFVRNNALFFWMTIGLVIGFLQGTLRRQGSQESR
jgi:O-antigen ligase